MHVSVWECVYQYLHKQRLEQPKLGAVSIHLPQMWPPQHFILPAVSVKLEEPQCLEPVCHP